MASHLVVELLLWGVQLAVWVPGLLFFPNHVYMFPVLELLPDLCLSSYPGWGHGNLALSLGFVETQPNISLHGVLGLLVELLICYLG